MGGGTYLIPEAFLVYGYSVDEVFWLRDVERVSLEALLAIKERRERSLALVRLRAAQHICRGADQESDRERNGDVKLVHGHRVQVGRVRVFGRVSPEPKECREPRPRPTVHSARILRSRGEERLSQGRSSQTL